MTHSRFAFFACALLLLGACSKEKDIEPPAKLVAIPATLRIDRVWGSSVAGGDPVLRLGLGISVDGDRAYASGRQGDVAAFDLKSGKKVWDVRLKIKLSGGTGAGNGLVVVGSSKGEVIALEAASGAVRWKAHVGGEVLSAPAVAAQTVIVRAVDGKLHGLALQDGHEAWLQEQQVPRLSLRGTPSPVVAGEAVLCGFDNGKVISVNEADGTLAWEAIVAPPRGRTELERLVDVDSAVKVIGDDVYAVGFQGRAVMLALENGQVWWSRELSSYRGLDVDADSVFVSTAEGEVVSLRRKTGAELWRQKALARRGLSAPAALDNAVAVGDFEGYVHWLDKTTGAIVARESLGGRISNPPVVAGDLLLVINDVGRIAAFRARSLHGP